MDVGDRTDVHIRPPCGNTSQHLFQLSYHGPVFGHSPTPPWIDGPA